MFEDQNSVLGKAVFEEKPLPINDRDAKLEQLDSQMEEMSQKLNEPLAIKQNNVIGRNGRNMPFEVVSFCDETSWAGSTIVNDTVNTRYGTMGKQTTAVASGEAQLALTKNINAAGKLLVIDWYSTTIENLSYFRVMLQINGSWTTYISMNIEPKVGREFRNGWNRIIVNPLLFSGTGVTDIAASLDKITAIRIRSYARASGNFICTFDRIGLIDNPLKEAIITLTFDDGNASDYTTVRPYMNKYNFAGVSYVPPTFIGSEGRMTLDQLKDLYDNGWDIGAHGWSHTYDLATEAIIKDEMIRPYEWLVKNGFLRSADHMAFPGGITDDNIEAVVKQIYKTARTTAGVGIWALNTLPVMNPLRLKTVDVTSSRTLTEMKAYVDKAIASKSWLIFMFHDIKENPSGSGWNTPNFQALIDYIAEKESAGDLTVKTMSEMSDYMPESISGRVERQTRYNDIEIADATKGIILTSPNGTKYRMTIGDNGTPTYIAI